MRIALRRTRDAIGAAGGAGEVSGGAGGRREGAQAAATAALRLRTLTYPPPQTVELKPDWAKGYSRLGAAFHGLRDYEQVQAVAMRLVACGARLSRTRAQHGAAAATQAFAAFNKGLQIDPSNEQLKSGLADAEEAQARPHAKAASRACVRADGITRAQAHMQGGGGGGDGIGSLFTAPDALGKLMTNPTTRAYMQQPDFVAIFNVRPAVALCANALLRTRG